MYIALSKPTMLRQCKFTFPQMRSIQKLLKKHFRSLYTITLPHSNAPLPSVWLRDHCRCKRCYDYSTHQRTADLPEGNMVQIVNHEFSSSHLLVNWADGHQSTFDVEWLRELSDSCAPPHEEGAKVTGVERCLWNSDKLKSAGGIPSVAHQDIFSNDTFHMRNFYTLFLRYGICAVKEAPTEKKAFEQLCERLSLVQLTNFGCFSYMISDKLDHADSAYGTDAINPHSDSTYRLQTPGVQVFSCLEESAPTDDDLCVSYYVDAFHAAERLREEEPSAFALLSTLPVPHHYIDLKRRDFLHADRPVLTLDGDGRLEQIRFNPLDRAPLPLRRFPNPAPFYEAYRALAERIYDEQSKFHIRLSPGTVMFVDNWRVLHARSAFRGRRVLAGCYFPRDDFLSRAKAHGVTISYPK